jgi:Cu(I)/Ag(I) efflux system membrane fusion protein
MDFKVDDDIDITKLKAGMSLHLQITKLDTGDYLVTTIHIVDEMGNMSGMDDMEDMDEIEDIENSDQPAKEVVDHSAHGGQH